ncbi:MAG: 4Fe-4S dicluster domain-containing protein [Actinobacteria bacterium]|nr:MAG: 4Fe-4S dicluster domain-containing protein [Actinomycetota bacterium]
MLEREGGTTMVDIAAYDQVYVRLREFLDRLPSGLPVTESGVELRLLKKLFTPEEAVMAMELRLFPEPARVIARRCGMDEGEAAEMLESMAKKGLVLRVRGGKEKFYIALHLVVGIYEFHLGDIDTEMAEMMEEFIEAEEHTPNFRRTAVEQFRVVPVNSAVEAVPEIAAYDRIRELVSKYDDIAVAPCICRLEKGLMGEECERPHETCLTFGVGAQLYIDNGIGRRIDVEEALRILDMAEKAALVLQPSNNRDIINICCCCSCCCGILRLLKMEERPADHVHASFSARVDSGRCTSCGTCLERCQMDAIVEDEEAMEVDPARCIGCGLCVSSCPEGALAMFARPDAKTPPSNYFHNLTTISKERGLPFGNLSPVMRFTNLPLFLKVLPYLYKTGLVTPVVNQLARRGWV